MAARKTIAESLKELLWLEIESLTAARRAIEELARAAAAASATSADNG